MGPRRGEHISLVVVANNDNSGKTGCLEFLIAGGSLVRISDRGFFFVAAFRPSGPCAFEENSQGGNVRRKAKEGRPRWPSAFSKESGKTRGKKLELEADVELRVARGVALSRRSTPARQIAQRLTGIGKDHVVQSVEANRLELCAKALRGADILAHAEAPCLAQRPIRALPGELELPAS